MAFQNVNPVRLEVDGTNGSKIIISAEDPENPTIQIFTAPIAGHSSEPGSIQKFDSTTPTMLIQSPGIDGQPTSEILMAGESFDHASQPNITISAPLGGIRLDCSQLFLVDSSTGFIITKQAWMLTKNDDIPSSGPLNLTAVASPGVAIPGCSITYNNLRPGTKWHARLTMDVSIGAAAGITAVGELQHNANAAGLVTEARQCLYRAGAAINTGDMPSQEWDGVLAAGGTILFQAMARQVGAGGVNTINATHTNLHIDIYE